MCRFELAPETTHYGFARAEIRCSADRSEIQSSFMITKSVRNGLLNFACSFAWDRKQPHLFTANSRNKLRFLGSEVSSEGWASL